MARIITVGAAQLGPIARDELIVAEVDLDRCREIQDNVFNFALHREPQNYGLISRPRAAAALEDHASANPKPGGKIG